MTWHPVVNEWNTWEVWFRFYLFHPFHMISNFSVENAVLGIERQAACHPLPCFPGSADPIWPPLLFTTTGNRHTSLAQRKVSTFQPDLQNTSQADLTCRILVYANSWASYQFWKKFSKQKMDSWFYKCFFTDSVRDAIASWQMNFLRLGFPNNWYSSSYNRINTPHQQHQQQLTLKNAECAVKVLEW